MSEMKVVRTSDRLFAGFTTAQQQQAQANYIYQKQREGSSHMLRAD